MHVRPTLCRPHSPPARAVLAPPPRNMRAFLNHRQHPVRSFSTLPRNFVHSPRLSFILYYIYHRMLHPSDPTQGYPLTLHITPPIIDLCMACSRVPAALSIVGDIRLGQSPFKICRPCWQLFGGEPPPGDSTSISSEGRDNVLVVPLPKYEHGW